MVGREMLVAFFCLGPTNSDFSISCAQITDSPYVVHSETILYRWGYEQFKKIGSGTNFFRFMHTEGELEGGVSKNVDKFKMYIYNRWGILIYETNNPGNGWDGKFNGSECPLGIYIWKIIYDDQDIEEHITNKTLLGHVTLVR